MKQFGGGTRLLERRSKLLPEIYGRNSDLCDGADGFVTKEDAIKATEGAEGWTDVDIQDVLVIELTADAAAVAYHATAKSAKSASRIEARSTRFT